MSNLEKARSLVFNEKDEILTSFIFEGLEIFVRDLTLFESDKMEEEAKNFAKEKGLSPAICATVLATIYRYRVKNTKGELEEYFTIADFDKLVNTGTNSNFAKILQLGSDAVMDFLAKKNP